MASNSNSITPIPPKDDWKSFLLFLKFKEDKHKVVFDAVVDSLSSPGQLAFLPGTDEARLNQWHVWLDEHEVKVNDQRTAILSGLQALLQAPPPSPGSVPIPKRYPVAEPYADASQFFVVNRTLMEVGVWVLAIIRSGGQYLLHGPRQGSKTTTILQCIKSLSSEFQIIYMSWEDVDKNKSFFECFSKYIESYYDTLPKLDPTKTGFDNYFSKTNFAKRVVLVFDEFDMALDHTSTKDLLVSLRSYKVKRNTDSTALHVVVGVGTYQLQDLVEMEEDKIDKINYLSPFNVHNFYSLPPFSRHEHQNLHIEQAGLPREFEEAIWELTSGLPGASVWLGADARAALLAGPATVASWLLQKRRIIADFASTVTMKRMLKIISGDGPTELLMSTLRADKPRQIFSEEEGKIAVRLVASGVVKMIQTENAHALVPTASIIQQVAIFHMDVITNSVFGGISFPLLPNGDVDIYNLLCISISNFDWNAVLSPHATKELRVAEFRLDYRKGPVRQIAGERAFQVELILALRVLLQRKGYPISLCVPESKEKNESATQRLDILLKNHSCYVLELCANVNTSELNEHLQRTAKYAKFYNSTRNYCINFVGFDFHEVQGYPPEGHYTMEQKTVQLIHVRYFDSNAFPSERGDTTVYSATQTSTIPRCA